VTLEVSRKLRAEFEIKLAGVRHDAEQAARDHQPSSVFDQRRQSIATIPSETERRVAQGALHQDEGEMNLQEQRNIDEFKMTPSESSRTRRDSTLTSSVRRAISNRGIATGESSNKIYSAKRLNYRILRELNFYVVKDLLTQA
jgi:hypothetical protein